MLLPGYFKQKQQYPATALVRWFRKSDCKVVVSNLSTESLLLIIGNLVNVTFCVGLQYISLALLLFFGNLVDILFCIDLQSLMLLEVFFMNGGQCSGIYSLLGTSCRTRRVRCVYGLICIPCIFFIMFFSILYVSVACMWMYTLAFLMHSVLFAFFSHFAT